MLPAICCFLLAYLAIVAQWMGTPFGPVSPHLPVIVVVLAVRWFSPSVAAAWAFAIGLALDAHAAGPLGLHAALFVLIAYALSHAGFSLASSASWRWMQAVFVAAWCDALIPRAWELFAAQNWQLLRQTLMSCTASSLLAAAVIGMICGIIRQATHRPHWAGS